jgi:multiple sugar transport system substrate-binding protein/raffinose/stachyose/melibiose transport system substrate-binding protein
MKKMLISLLLISILAMALAACGSPQATEAPKPTEKPAAAEATKAPEATEAPAPTEAPKEEPKEDVTITMMVFESPALTAEHWDKAIATVLEGLPDYIHVEKITTPNLDRDGYAKQLQATGQFPDIPFAVTISDFAAAGLLAPFDEDYLEENFVLPDASKTDGFAYHPPKGAQIIPFVYYNKDIFNEVGVEVPKTYSEFVEVSKKIKDAGYTPILMCGAEPWCASFPAAALFSADVFGDNPDWMKQRKAGEVHFADDNVVAAFQKLQDWVDEGIIDSGEALGTDFQTANQAFYDGEAAMYFQGSWLIGQGYVGQDEAITNRTGIFVMPRDDGQLFAPIYVGDGVRMSAVSEHPEEVKMFVEGWGTNREIMKDAIEKDASFPMLKGMTMDDWKNDYGVQVSDLYAEGYDYAVNPDIKKVSAFTWSNNDDDVIGGMKEEIYKSIQNIVMGKDVKAEMERLDKAWDELAASTANK